ncbi:uncharacterized protein LOC119461813 isoform X3 [Dermacentor silvarum]|uniref:uncharacterized protein LOC119461813 isoform X3 n=1 Tax=Dermacentor silvarum TaxID=543639 RepID=UPI002100F385|nr:uncharacterized protein LOC119461813 isoform X3 [Dermacentor silvarum]
MPRGLAAVLTVLWVATRSRGSDLVFLYPTITFPRNITMGLGTFVNFRCELNVSEGSANEMFWLQGGARIPNDSRRHSRLEVPSEGRYISYLEVRDLRDVDAGRYTCDARARLNNLNLVRVIPDSVYLSVAGSHLGESCVEDNQCRWFTQFAVCLRGWCQCADAYTISRDGSQCIPVVPEGQECTMDWECEQSGMVCIERSCRYKVAVSGGQIAVLVLLSIIGACLLVYLIILLVRRSRNKKKMQEEPIYIIPLGR